MGKLLCLAILIVSCASMAFAQGTDDYNKVEFYGGYSHNRVDTGIGDDDPALSDIINEREGFNGFNAAVNGNITRYVGLKLDVAGHYKQRTFDFGAASLDFESSIYNVLGGVQIKDNSKEAEFKPFAHALIGLAHAKLKTEFNGGCIAVFPSPCPPNITETDTGWAGAFGGGFDLRLNDRFDVRLVQFDYNPTRVFDGPTQHNFRIGAGIVIH